MSPSEQTLKRCNSNSYFVQHGSFPCFSPMIRLSSEPVFLVLFFKITCFHSQQLSMLSTLLPKDHTRFWATQAPHPFTGHPRNTPNRGPCLLRQQAVRGRQPEAARATNVTSLLHGPLWVDWNAETKIKQDMDILDKFWTEFDLFP